MFKKADIFVIVLVLLLTLAGTLGAWWLRDTGTTVTVTVDGQVFATCPLDTDRVLPVSGNGNNHIVIEHGKVYMQSADCPDKLCVHHAPISAGGESIVCLPNGVVVEID